MSLFKTLEKRESTMTRKKYVYNYEPYDTWSQDPEERWKAAMKALGVYLKEHSRDPELNRKPVDGLGRDEDLEKEALYNCLMGFFSLSDGIQGLPREKIFTNNKDDERILDISFKINIFNSGDDWSSNKALERFDIFAPNILSEQQKIYLKNWFFEDGIIESNKYSNIQIAEMSDEYVFEPYDSWDREDEEERWESANRLFGQVIMHLMRDQGLKVLSENSTEREREFTIKIVMRCMLGLFSLLDGIVGIEREEVFSKDKNDERAEFVSVKLSIFSSLDDYHNSKPLEEFDIVEPNDTSELGKLYLDDWFFDNNFYGLEKVTG